MPATLDDIKMMLLDKFRADFICAHLKVTPAQVAEARKQLKSESKTKPGA